MQRICRIALIASLFFGAGAAHSSPVTYTIVSKLSRVNFSIQHQGFIQLVGTLKVAPGSFIFDAQDWSKSSVSVNMPTKMLDMGDALWNRQIRGDDAWTALFLPTNISFKSTKLERRDDTHGVLTGDLTMAGVTKPVTLQVRINKIGRNEVSEKQSIGVTATGTVKRSEWKLDAYKDLVSDDITFQIQVEAAIGPDTDAEQEALLNAQGN
ncbi:MAG: YceI family protein [Burkholderiales bacterium]|nr:YceI family protein [Burkholderiales bacterium]